ncbi:MAG: hypothetical protein V4683_16405 [Bacteroidota bacterium]
MESLFNLSTFFILIIILLVGYIGKLKGWFAKKSGVKIFANKIAFSFKDVPSSEYLESLKIIFKSYDYKLEFTTVEGKTGLASLTPITYPPKPPKIDPEWLIKAIESDIKLSYNIIAMDLNVRFEY